MTDNIAAQAELAFQRALTCHRQGRLNEAQRLYYQTLELQPQHAPALHLLGVIAAQTHNLERAVELFAQAILKDPLNAAAYKDHGLALCRLNRHEEAIASFDRAIVLEPANPETHFSRANALRECKRLKAAIAGFDAAIALKPDYARAYNNRGNAHRELRQFEAAVASYDRAIAIEPDAADAYVNRGNALCEMRLPEAALASFGNAIAIEPKNAAAYVNRGLALAGLKRYGGAISDYDRAISLSPNTAEAFVNRGQLLAELRHYETAFANYDQAIAINPDYAKAYFSKGLLFAELRQFEAAIACYDRAIALKPDLKGARGTRQFAKMTICDWNNSETEIALLIGEIDRNEPASDPFSVLALTSSASLQKKAAEIWVAEEYPLACSAAINSKRTEHDKVRLGYFSADFGDHPVSVLTAELFEIHDRADFEVTAFSFGPNTQDAMRKRMERAFDRFIDVRAKSDQEIALLARDIGIDIAVDLGGFTKDSKPMIFAMRAAPLQVNFLGYSGTMGAEYMDYLVADRTVIPEDSRRHYSEKIVYLPDSYLPNDSTRAIAEKKFTREELGLPAAAFVFCCFNNSYKISPDTFDVWMRILRRVEGSVLWLSESNPAAVGNLRKEAESRNVSADRLIVAKRLASLPEHLARLRAADLFIDTLPYNAHTTASDALWAGLPVLTCVGDAFASRVAASLLSAVELPELATRTLAEYEELAVELAGNSQRLREIKQTLARNRLSAPLFDTRLYTKHLEAAYLRIYERHEAGQPPAHIYVESSGRGR
jgi:protein O-GlcNAc transferase